MKGTDTIDDVVANMCRLFKRTMVTDDMTQLRSFRQTSPPTYQQELMNNQPITFEEAADLAMQLTRLDHLLK
jgi:hypothetical protein